MDDGSPQVRVTIDDVAVAAGVSRQTVSRALNNKGEILPETKARVLAAIERLEYRPNAFARGMKTRRSQTIGLIVSDISNPFYPAVARGLFDAAAAAGWNVVVYNTDTLRAREEEALADLIGRGADGIAAFLYGLDDETIAKYAARVPLVIADREVDDPRVASVSTDFTAGTRDAVRRLVERGHQRIGMLRSTVGLAVDERRLAFLQVMEELVDRPGGSVVVEGPPTIQGGTAALHQLLNTDPEITGVVAFNDLMAVGAIHGARELGRQVPDDLAVVGFDDLAVSPYFDPPLTTVHTDKYAHGRALVEVLQLLVGADSATATGTAPVIRLPATLIARSSA